MQVPDTLKDLHWELPHSFLGLDEEASDFARAGAVILPVPYESTTSYGGGTRTGPRAILEASRYIELYDHELDAEPWERGICTLPSLELSRAGAEEAMGELRAAYARVLDAAGERFLVLLGGEHSLSGPPMQAWADRLERAGRRLSILQIDAHTDLRESYEGTAFSHASVMRTVSDRVDVVAVGIRAMTSEERAYARGADNVHIFFADDVQEGEGWIDEVIARLGDDVYITFDVDGLDPSLIPSTGTPEPGGLTWYPVMKLLRRVFAERRVHAADIVELAPLPSFPAPDFLVAKLLYKMIAYRLVGGR
ncbi:MAG TPA: agmatinase [Longimicrobiales bacterium]|nr:agmatinase [Longimicrobiales bacterium]